MKREYVKADKKEINKCVDAIFKTCEGRFTEVTLCATARVILDVFERRGAKTMVIYHGEQGCSVPDELVDMGD
jgi:hypothetical protein